MGFYVSDNGDHLRGIMLVVGIIWGYVIWRGGVLQYMRGYVSPGGGVSSGGKGYHRGGISLMGKGIVLRRGIN